VPFYRLDPSDTNSHLWACEACFDPEQYPAVEEHAQVPELPYPAFCADCDTVFGNPVRRPGFTGHGWITSLIMSGRYSQAVCENLVEVYQLDLVRCESCETWADEVVECARSRCSQSVCGGCGGRCDGCNEWYCDAHRAACEDCDDFHGCSNCHGDHDCPSRSDDSDEENEPPRHTRRTVSANTPLTPDARQAVYNRRRHSRERQSLAADEDSDIEIASGNLPLAYQWIAWLVAALVFNRTTVMSANLGGKHDHRTAT